MSLNDHDRADNKAQKLHKAKNVKMEISFSNIEGQCLGYWRNRGNKAPQHFDRCHRCVQKSCIDLRHKIF